MARIKVIPPNKAEGKLKEAYDHLVESRGKHANVHMIQSLNPKTIVSHMDLYMSIMFDESPLHRYQREMLAVITSLYNSCKYCVEHHKQALLHYWKDEERIDLLIKDYVNASISTKDKALCKMAHYLTIKPDYEGKDVFFNELREQQLSDREILDATLVIAYFNFVNRIVLNLGVDLEKDGGEDYLY